ncbi:MAG: hypothetical protein AB7O98_18825 [Hyphomonadaceae bacterium]
MPRAQTLRRLPDVADNPTGAANSYRAPIAFPVPIALRTLVHADGEGARHAVVVANGGRLFIVDPVPGIGAALHELATDKIAAILLTRIGDVHAAGLSELLTHRPPATPLPVFGPADVEALVDFINDDADIYDGGLEAWGPAPEIERPVIVFENDGAFVSAFASATSGALTYRFDHGQRSLVVRSDCRALAGPELAGAEVVFGGAPDVHWPVVTPGSDTLDGRSL